MARSDSRSVNRCGHGHLACKFPINVTVSAVDSLSRPQSRTGVKEVISAAMEVAQRTQERVREASALQRANTLALTIRGLLSLE